MYESQELPSVYAKCSLERGEEKEDKYLARHQEQECEAQSKLFHIEISISAPKEEEKEEEE